MTKIAVPPIKCQGIKTKLVPWIIDNIPGDISGKYIEPFLGSGVVAFNILPDNALLADLNPHIINFYKSINDGEINSGKVRKFLVSEGEKLSSEGEDYYYEVRDRFNEKNNPLDFLFLSRSCFNGLIRFNKSGEYNVPFGHKPERFSKAYVTKIVNQVKYVEHSLKIKNWKLVCLDFRETINFATKDDFIYCDPPYIGRHVDYYDSWDENDDIDLRDTIIKSGAKFILSTWHSNKYRYNEYIEKIWGDFKVLKREHFYHIGGSEDNRNTMIEALIMNYEPATDTEKSEVVEQTSLLK